MAYYNGKNAVGSRRSTGSLPCQFTFGGTGGQNGGGGFSASSTSFGNASVRDCMYWPASLPANVSQGFNYSNNGVSYNTFGQQNGGGGAYANVRATRQPSAAACTSYPQPKAFIQYQGMGAGGESKFQPMQIPCQMGPSGTQMGPLQSPEPLCIKVTAPVGAGQDGQPISIKIDPSQFMSMASVKTFPSGRR